MKWIDFLHRLDEIRVEIRSTKQMKQDVPEHDLIFDKMLALTYQCHEGKPVDVEDDETTMWEGLAGSLPDIHSEPEPNIVIHGFQVVDRGEGEGRMIVTPRKTPLVVRKPVLEEVFDEKDIGK